jgi:type I restriction enzyme S subunit
VALIWPDTKLAELLEPATRPHVVEPTSEYRLLGIRLDGAGPFVREVTAGSAIAAKTLYQVEAGDFIYSRLFAWRGAFAVVTHTLSGAFVSGEFPAFSVVADRLDARFLELWFRLPDVLAKVAAQCTGSTPLTRNRFKEERLLGLAIPLPPLPEQRRIVAKIKALAAKVEEVRVLRSAALTQARSVVVSLHLSLSGSNQVRLGDLVTLDERRQRVEPGRVYPQAGVKSFGLGLFPKPPVSAEETTYRHFNALYEGALVLSQVKGWEGAVAVCNRDLVGRFASPEYRTFRCLEGKALSDYMKTLVTTSWFHSHLLAATRGVGARRERVRPERFLEIRLPMPDVIAQAEGVRVFERLETLVPLQAQTAVDLDALMPSILDKAFRGEL